VTASMTLPSPMGLTCVNFEVRNSKI
jgi:hypothetical protein